MYIIETKYVLVHSNTPPLRCESYRDGMYGRVEELH